MAIGHIAYRAWSVVHSAVGNFVMVVDRHTGSVHALYCHSHRSGKRQNTGKNSPSYSNIPSFLEVMVSIY